MAGNKPGPKKGDPRSKEAGRKGGETIKQKVVKDKDYFARIGKKGGSSTKEKYGADFYAQIGRKGGETMKRERGPEFYSRIGQKGGSARRENVNVKEEQA